MTNGLKTLHDYSLKDTLTDLLTAFEPLIQAKKLTLTTADFDDVLLQLSAILWK
jgi:hypothetical protein